MTEAEARGAIVAAMRRLDEAGLNRGTSGNASIRRGDGFLVTPSGVRAEALDPDTMVAVAMDGTYPAGRRPSSEWRFHRDIYSARAEAGAIVHTHSTYATALASLRRSIPAFHYMVAVAGGRSIECAEYATFGTQALSDSVLAALDGRRACLIANHGQIAFGDDLDAAMRLAFEVEALAEQYAHVLQIGEPVLLDDAEMDRVLAKFGNYGSGVAAGGDGAG